MRRSSSYSYSRKRKFNPIKFTLKFIAISVLVFISIILITPTPFYKDGFKNLKELQAYASQTNEQTPMENTDTLKPDFTKYYQSLTPTFAQKIKNKINLLLYLVGIGEKPTWSVSFFKTILESTTKAQQKAGYEGNFIYKIQTDPNSKFIVFGNMQGAFHSLVRCLTKMKELNIIGDDLKINNSNNYMLFMGDVVDRSPFTLEILTTLIKLIEVNPQNVIYLKGNHESQNYWHEHTLKTELQIRAEAFLKNGSIPLEKEVNDFFNTLPLAVYLSIPNSQTDFVRISEASRSDNGILNEGSYADFLKQQQSSKLSSFIIKEKSATQIDPSINIKIIIKNEKKRKTFQKMEGLRLLTPDMGSVAWNILSCPTPVYQKALDFYNDAFVLVSAAEKLEDWEITLYSHDVRTKEPFKETKFNFLSGLDLQTHKKLAVQPSTQIKPQATVIPGQVPQVQPAQVATPAQTQPAQVIQQVPQQTQPQPQSVPVQAQQIQQQPPAPLPQQPQIQQPQVIVPVQQPAQTIQQGPQQVQPQVPQQPQPQSVPIQAQQQVQPPAPLPQQPQIQQPQVIVPVQQPAQTQPAQTIQQAPQQVQPQIPQQNQPIPAQTKQIQQPQSSAPQVKN